MPLPLKLNFRQRYHSNSPYQIPLDCAIMSSAFPVRSTDRLTQPTSTLRIGRDIFVHRAAVEDWTEFAELAFAEVFVEVDCSLLLFGRG